MTPPFGLDHLYEVLPFAALVAIPATVLLAYTIFGLTGFGSTIVAAPLLAQFFPLRFVVPLQLLLDLSASLTLGSRVHARINRREMAWLLPFMLAGIALGATLLVNLPGRALYFLLGAFVLVYGLLGLVGRAPHGKFAQWWVAPAGVVGGVMSALFGTGGPVYVAYLASRIADPAELRATIAAVVMLSALTRLIFFGAAGLLAQDGLIALAVLVLPLLAAGIWLGMHLHHRLRPVRVRQAVYALLIASGSALLLRSLGAAAG